MDNNDLKVSPESERSIRDMSKRMKDAPAQLAKNWRLVLKAIAEGITSDLKGKVPHKSGRMASSVKARATATGASIAVGNSTAPYYMLQDFGGSTGRGHVSKMAGSGCVHIPWMGKPIGEGRYLYPTIREHIPDTQKKLEDALNKAEEAIK